MRLDKHMLQLTLNKPDQQEIRNDLKNCFDGLTANLENMLNRLDTQPINADLMNRIEFFFGAVNQQTLNIVRQKIKLMLRVIQRPISLSVKWADTQGDNCYAHVYPDVNPMKAGILFIYLDNRYKIPQEHGLNNRYLTLVHEFSHLAAQTQDYKYDEDIFWRPEDLNRGHLGNCIKPYAHLNYTPELASNNADSYGFLMAATYARMDGCTLP